MSAVRLIHPSAKGLYPTGTAWQVDLRRRNPPSRCSPRWRTDGADRRRCRAAGAPRAIAQAGAPRATTQRGDGAARCRRADHGDRLDQVAAGHALRRRRLDPARAGVDRRQGARDAGRRLRRGREERGPPLEHVRRRPYAAHAAHHLERHRAARRAAARVCGLARLRTDALWLCGKVVRQDADRDAGDHLAERRGAGRVLPPGAPRAERGGACGCAGARRGARPRGRGGRQGQPTRRKKPRRQQRARQHRSPRRCASWNSSRPAPTPSSRAPRRRSPPQRPTRPGRGPRSEAEGHRQGRGSGDAARDRQGRREGEARRRRHKGGRQGGRDQEGRRRQGGERGEARAGAGLDLHQPRDE